jgi:predicted nucleotidyltransferase
MNSGVDAHLDRFIRMFEAFEKTKVRYILIGGFAVVLYGMQRLTRDIDIFVEMVPDNIENLRRALGSVYEDQSIEEITFEELEKYSVIRYVAPDGFCVDIISRLGDAFSYKDLDFKKLELEGIEVRIATPETLLRLKKDTVRPEDKMDAAFLEELFKKAKDD